MENNNDKLNMDDFNNLLNKIKMGSPVHKINLNSKSDNIIAGMYLATIKDLKSYMHEMLDLDNLNNDTLLVFESRHVIECCQIIYGYVEVMNNSKAFKFEIKYIIENIIKILLKSPMFYLNMISDMDNFVNCAVDTSVNNGEIILESFRYIMKNIWFLPYSEIDKICKEAISNFQKHYKDGNNNG